jgi:hypothetical protein
MTYWIVIAMIFIAVAAVALATAHASDSGPGAVADDDASIEEGSTDDDHL